MTGTPDNVPIIAIYETGCFVFESSIPTERRRNGEVTEIHLQGAVKPQF